MCFFFMREKMFKIAHNNHLFLQQAYTKYILQV
jgi:hypothetical protein